jgi:Histidine kinase-, DNA gyrase B-, and HSP90-like ATPase
MPPVPTEQRDSFAKKIREARPGDKPLRNKLATSDRVLRRVTDGIYREPWAAIRELISNAYDADATSVVVSTDAPRFQQITVRDNGNGFTADALAAMCTSIGGSAKRTPDGKDIGVTSPDDPDLSPGGRRLIGKLGIGLFAVSQLTQQFRIVTKIKGAKERIVADVILFRYAERRGQKTASEIDRMETTGEVKITKIAASDVDAHGTDVIIDSLLPRARDEFQSRDIWELIRHPPTEAEGGGSVIRPEYHIGFAEAPKRDSFVVKPSLPWADEDKPIVRFRKFAEAMYDQINEPHAGRRPSLERTFDNYLRFLWLISLSIPIDYLEQHPFDVTRSSGNRIFQLGKMKTGRAEEIKLRDGETVRDRLDLKAPERGGNPKFEVIMDELELRRPISFANLPKTSSAVKTPLLFVGADAPNMSKFPDPVTGGRLRFEGYLLWTPRVVPIEHNGVLIRIGDASGSLFDETFMRYQISEQKRKEQVTAEIFVHEGMDAALNIDRESFNHSHPHYQYIAAWVHDAFKQLATRHKGIGVEVRKHQLATSHAVVKQQLQSVVEEVVADWTDGDEEPVRVEFVKDDTLFTRKDKKNVLLIGSDVLEEAVPPGSRVTPKKATEYDENQARFTAIAQLLYAAGTLDKLSPEKRQKLLADLARIIFFRVAE